MSADGYTHFPPGTHLLEDQSGRGNDKQKIILNPTPSNDPDDPLNWSTLRKALNFGLTCSYVLFTFVLLDIGSPAFKFYEQDLGFQFSDLTKSRAGSYAGLALGCIFFIPCVHKFGRRPVYLVCGAIQLASAIWYANFTTVGEMVTISFLSGLAGSTCEAIVMITIVDLFFVHQHARMNGLFLFMQSLGTLGGPIAGGFILVNLQWRWVWWITAIFVGTNLLLVLFLFEESKYTPRSGSNGYSKISRDHEHSSTNDASSSNNGDLSEYASNEPLNDSKVESQTYTRKPYFQRLALVTKTEGPILRNFYRPLMVPFLFPIVIFTALQYGIIQAWFTATATAGNELLKKDPWNFQPNQIGLFNLGGFTGCFIAAFTITFLSDWLVVWQARRNKGIFEPEMRLWLLFPSILLTVVGSWVYGIGLAKGWAWIILAVGNGIFGFGFMVTADVTLTYLTDSYPLILNDALIAVVLIRNGLAMIVEFGLSPWIDGMGVQNTFLLIGIISLATMILPATFMFYGKRSRAHTEQKYTEFATYQQSQRPQ